MYINGLGFVNESAAVTAKTDNKVNNKSKAGNTIFDDVLEKESAKYNKKVNSDTIDLKSIFKEASEKYNVSYDMLTAIAWHESRFQPDVTSYAGAMGLMQLMPGTAEAMGVKDGYDPYQNVMGAAKLLGYLSDTYDGDTTLTLAAYAAGTGSVAKYGGVPPYGETQEFVSTITKLLNNGGVDVPDKEVTINSANADKMKTSENKETTAAESTAAENKSVPVTEDKSAAPANSAAKTDHTGKKSAAQSVYESSYADAARRVYAANSNIYDKFYTTSNIDDVLSYSDYQMLMYYYKNMMDIISNIGTIDDDLYGSSSNKDILAQSMLANNLSATEDKSSLDVTNARTADILNSALSDSQAVYNAMNRSLLDDMNFLNSGAIISGTAFTRLADSGTQE